MDIRKVKKLIELVEDSQVAEIEIDDDEGKIRISRATAISAPVPVTQSPISIPSVSPSPQTKVDTIVEEEPKGNLVRSPMVGTFYSASSPDQEAFVRIGSKVQAGQTMCIIEAMKVMNQITSEYSGEVVEILVTNAQPVEFDQPLFRIQ